MSTNHHHRCPAWVAKLLASPLRRLAENPETTLGDHVRPGMTVLEPGPGLGFYTLPLARMVGPEGRVITLEVQESLRNGLARRVRKAGLTDRVDCLLCDAARGVPDLPQGGVDFCAALHVLHELEDQAGFLAMAHGALRPGGRMLVMEPRGHVSEQAFAASLDLTRNAGLMVVEAGTDPAGRRALLAKPE